MRKMRVGVAVLLLTVIVSGVGLSWSIPGLGNIGKKEANTSSDIDEYKDEMAKIMLTRDVIDRFLKVYPVYKKLVDTCAPGEDENITLATQKCGKKLVNLLKKYKFSVGEFGGVFTRLAYAYARAKMQGNSPFSIASMFDTGLTSTGQKKLTSDEIKLVKQYIDKLAKIFGED